MRPIHDEFNPLSEEELERQRADEELARRIRNEIRRVQSGQADEQMAQEASRRESKRRS